jgi:hypothetical protein
MHLLHQIIPDIVSTGFAGLFLDTIEIQDRYPEMRQSVVRLIQSIRKHYPDLLLIGNRGFSILDEIAGSLDAILFEAFSSHYTNGQYQTWKNDEWAWTEHMAKLLQTIYGKCTILALDYADPEDLTLHSLAKERSQAFGFLSFVTTWKIDWLPETEVNS